MKVRLAAIGSVAAVLLSAVLLSAGVAGSAGPSPVLARINLGTDAWVVATGGDGSVWTDGPNGLVRIDPATDRISVRTRIRGTANAGLGSIWVPSGRTLYRLSPTTGAVQATIRLPHDAESAAAGRGVVWLTSPETKLLMRLDMKTRDLQADESLGLNCAWYADILMTLTRKHA